VVCKKNILTYSSNNSKIFELKGNMEFCLSIKAVVSGAQRPEILYYEAGTYLLNHQGSVASNFLTRFVCCSRETQRGILEVEGKLIGVMTHFGHPEIPSVYMSISSFRLWIIQNLYVLTIENYKNRNL